MVIKKDGCDLYELENVLSQYIEKDEVKTFVSKICGNEYKHRQCQMTYEKTEQKKKAQMNLENCRSFRLWQPTATLDGTKKNCCRLITDGEELKNSQSFSVDYSSVAVLFRAIKGTPLCGGWDNYLWL